MYVDRSQNGSTRHVTDFRSSAGYGLQGKSRDRGIDKNEFYLIESRGIERELPQSVSRARRVVTMGTAWHPRGIKVGPIRARRTRGDDVIAR